LSVYLDARDLLAEAEHDSLAAQVEGQCLKYLLVHKVEKSGPLFDHRHLDAERGQHRSVFDPDHTRADYY
jgi:hypothetical protein